MKASVSRGAATLLLLGAGATQAHTGHGTEGLAAGLLHPFAIDHMLAMVAVGVWSAAALQGARRWLGPLTFLGVMAVGAVLAMAGLALPGVEFGIAASVVVLGGLLAFPARVPVVPGLLLIGAAALLHGLAHGSELPATAHAVAYFFGFLSTTALLHIGGLAAGLRLAAAAPRAWQTLGALLGCAGLVLLVRL